MLKRRMMLATLSLFVAPPSAIHAQNGANGWNPQKIMDTIYTAYNNKDIVMIAAHRGLHAIYGTDNFSDTPENSLQSIQNAAENGCEIVEIDVRLTQDGVPILSHDSTWGRETNAGDQWGAPEFNPWGYLPGLTVPDGDPGELGGGADSSSDPQASVNPNVNGWSLWSVQNTGGTGLKLRNSQNFKWSTWGETPPTLQAVLDFVKNNRYGIVLAIDIKDNNAMQAAWQVVAHNTDYTGLPYASSVFFKFDAAWVFPYPDSFENAFSGSNVYSDQPDYGVMHIMPVFQTSGIDPKLYGSESKMLTAEQNYEHEQAAVGVEINLKQFPGILGTLVEDYNFGEKAVGEFNPYAEWVNPNDPAKIYQYFYSNGYCCAQLNSYFYHGAQSDTADNRPDWNFLLGTIPGGSAFNLITTDNPQAMASWLAGQGRRNTSYFVQ